LSVEADQVRLTWEEETAVAMRPVGMEGAVVSTLPVMVMVPPVPETERASAFRVAPSVPVSVIDVDGAAVKDVVTFTTATTPFPMVLEFNPVARHV